MAIRILEFMQKAFFCTIILIFLGSKLSVAQYELHVSTFGAGLFNYANQIKKEDQGVDGISYNMNSSYGVNAMLQFKRVALEAGWQKVNNANRFILKNAVFFKSGFKLPDVNLKIKYSEVPVRFLFTPFQNEKISFQTIFGVSLIILNEQGVYNISGAKNFEYEGETFVLNFSEYYSERKYHSWLINSGVRMNYSFKQNLAFFSSLIFKQGFKPFYTSNMRYDVYKKNVNPTPHYGYDMEIANTGNSISLDFGIRYRVGKHF